MVVGMGGCDVKLTNSHLARTHEPRAAGRAGASPQGRAFSEHSWFHTDPKGEGRVTHGLYMRMQMLRVAGGGWDWAGRWRSRSWRGKHARLVHVFAMKTGVGGGRHCSSAHCFSGGHTRAQWLRRGIGGSQRRPSRAYVRSYGTLSLPQPNFSHGGPYGSCRVLLAEWRPYHTSMSLVCQYAQLKKRLSQTR